MSYGTGAIMAVPAHDTRDWDFAKKFDLPIIEVVKGGDVEEEAFTDCETGMMVNSGFLDGLTVEEAKEKIIRSGSKKRGKVTLRSTTSCATGYSPVSVTGVSQFRSYTVKNAVMFRCRKASCL